jgi:tRNA uridine 5-carboxymethylaminomethyl modification enzyme
MYSPNAYNSDAHEPRAMNEFILSRSESYIGTLIDDLITKDITEPYRMMTARSEYRLLLRQDNADARLTEKGYQLGLISEDRYAKFKDKQARITGEIERLKTTFVFPKTETIAQLAELGEPLTQKTSLADLLARPKMSYKKLSTLHAPRSTLHLPPSWILRIETELKYSGYLKRLHAELKQFESLEKKKLPAELDYLSIKGLRKEAQTKLHELRPVTLGQASRIAGVNPADIAVLMIALRG